MTNIKEIEKLKEKANFDRIFNVRGKKIQELLTEKEMQDKRIRELTDKCNFCNRRNNEKRIGELEDDVEQNAKDFLNADGYAHKLLGEVAKLKEALSKSSANARGIIKKFENRDIDKEIHENKRKFRWLGEDERRHIDFDNGFQFAINELEKAIETFKKNMEIDIEKKRKRGSYSHIHVIKKGEVGR